MTSIDLLKLVDPGLYYSKFLSGGVFPDGRTTKTFKPYSFKRGVVGGSSATAGSALVSQGGVTMVCTIRASVTPRCTQSPLTVRFEDSGEQLDADARLEVVAVVEELGRVSAFLHAEALVAEDDRLEWKLEATFRMLHAEGDAVSACIGGLLAALTDVRLPRVRLDHDRDDESPLVPAQIVVEEGSRPLKLSAWPVASTFLLFRDAQMAQILCDPPAEVRALCDTQCTVVIGEQQKEGEDKKQTVLSLRTSGPIEDDQLREMVAAAESRQNAIVAALRV